MTKPPSKFAIPRKRLASLAVLTCASALIAAAPAPAQTWVAPQLSPEVKAAMEKAATGQPADLLALADAGRADAEFNAGVMLIQGRGGVMPDPKKGCAYEEKASATRADAAYLAGECWQNGLTGTRDTAKAEAAYQKSMQMGFSKSRCALGEMLLSEPGHGERGLALCKESANAGEVDAQLVLANAYFRGLGVKADHKEARNWYNKAADLKNPQAMRRLGEMYVSGDGGKKDAKKAVALWQDAEKAGDPMSAILVADQLFSDLTGGKKPAGGTYSFKGGVPVSDLEVVENWYEEALKSDPRPDVKQRAERGIQVVKSLKAGAAQVSKTEKK
jgi:TPR repeat protein